MTAPALTLGRLEFLARLAYVAYGNNAGGVNYRGDRMPAWDDLPSGIQDNWIAAVTAVHMEVAP